MVHRTTETDWKSLYEAETRISARQAAEIVQLRVKIEEANARLVLLERLAKKSRTGVSFDWSPEEGFRLMTFHNLRRGYPTIAECIDTENISSRSSTKAEP